MATPSWRCYFFGEWTAGYNLDIPSDAQEKGRWNAVSGLSIVTGSFDSIGRIRATVSKVEDHAP